MPLYIAELSIPANTPPTSPQKAVVELWEEVLEQVIILIPAGHMALTGLKVFYGDEQLIPKPHGAWLKGDNLTLSFKMMWRLPERPTRLRLEGYNNDDTYDHTFYLYFITAMKEEAEWWRGIKDFADTLKRLIFGERRVPAAAPPRRVPRG